ncbi:GAF domain-containing protein [Fulvivirgaceae bacterium BMA10]|uniref:GAF domain-containing protein n=1 Tax=Splendidivirga corallicola TaxID=3051826 RepID=A0ABT8KY20_9BACT|nr:GAF domain-containing protein [Fulvivirgaceae bacterium BMA10]
MTHKDFDSKKEKSHRSGVKQLPEIVFTKRRWTIGRKLYFGFGLLLLIFTTSSLINYSQLSLIGNETEELVEHAMPLENYTKELESTLFRQQLTVSKYLESPNEIQKDLYHDQKRKLNETLMELHHVAKTKDEVTLLALIEKKINELERMGEEAMQLEDDLWKQHNLIEEDLDLFKKLLNTELKPYIPVFSGNRTRFKEAILNLEIYIAAIDAGLFEYLFSGSEESKVEFISAVQHVDQWKETLEKTVKTQTEIDWVRKMDDLLNKIEKAEKILIEDFERSHADLAQIEKSTDSLYKYMGEKMVDYADDLIAEDSKNIKAAISYADFLLLIFTSTGFILSSFIAHRTTENIKNPIVQLNKVFTRMCRGELPETTGVKSNDEIGDMSDSAEVLIEGLKNTASFAENVGNGQLDEEFTTLGDKDILGKSLLAMRDKLKKTAKEDKRREWSAEGLARFAEILRSNQEDLHTLSYNIVVNFVKYFDANQGAFFILNDDNPAKVHLELTACYAWGSKKFIESTIEKGQGLVGQCWLEQETIYITEVPAEYAKITSGLGEATPRCVLILPLKLNDEIHGVIELTFFEKLEKYEIELAEKLAEGIASTISSVKNNERTRSLLKETQQQAEELRATEEEIRQNSEELLATQEELVRQKREMEETLHNLKRKYGEA